MVGNYRFGSLEVDGEPIKHDIIYRGGKIVRWWREKGHRVGLGDIRSLLDDPPEAVVFGTGAVGLMKVAEEVREALEEAGAEVIVEKTSRAVERFNALAAQGRDVALAVHLTC